MQRRSFLAHGALGAAGALGLPRIAFSSGTRLTPSGLVEFTPIDDPTLKALAAAALDAAKLAGATYADVRFTTTCGMRLTANGAGGVGASATEHHAAGVRVLVHDAWGFVSSADLVTDNMVALATEAVAQARMNHWATTKPVVLAPVPPVANGRWATPEARDPFTVPLEEQFGVMLAAHETVLGKPGLQRIDTFMYWMRQEKTFVSSEGSYLTQTLFRSNGNGTLRGAVGEEQAKGLDLTAAGYEVLTAAKLEEQYPAMLERANTPRKRSENNAVEVDVGRYDVVMPATTMAAIIDATVGQALQLDRSLGFEANADGTSYLAPPDEWLGKALAPSFVTITADRSQPHGLATVKWDDEGVEPEEYAIVKNGIVTDYHTTRAQAPWLSSWYAQQQRGVRSHGDADATDAFFGTMQFMPNLALQPAEGTATQDSLVSQVKKGILILDFGFPPVMDQQLLNGFIFAFGIEIIDGKLGRPLKNVGFQFRAPEFWKNVTALGGAGSAQSIVPRTVKGEPQQVMYRTVKAVPALVSQMNVINVGLAGPAALGLGAK